MSLFVRNIQQCLTRLGYLKTQASGEIDAEASAAPETTAVTVQLQGMTA